MEKIQIDELKRIELEIMDEIDRICKENNIQYYLFGGTLIGAVRHKGFIPWDDDIDICMLREDYDRFESIMNSTKNEKIRLFTSRNTPGYFHPWNKVCAIGTEVIEPGVKPIKGLGVFIDIFPMDNTPNSTIATRVLQVRLYFNYKLKWYSSLKEYVESNNVIKNLVGKIMFSHARRFPPEKYARRMDKLSPRGLKAKQLINSMGGGVSVYSSGIFDKAIICDFEDREFPIPSGYDELLRVLYGDYMTLPPVEKRQGGHQVTAYRTNRSQ